MTETTPIRLTDRAAGHVKEWLDRQEASLIRLAIKPAGCSGSQYVVSEATEKNADDICFTSNGVSVVVDPKSLRYLQGTELDFVREGLNSRFRFNNPNVDQTCGCGESVHLKEDA